MKKYKWLMIVIAVIVIVSLIVGCIFLFKPKGNTPINETPKTGNDMFVDNIRAEYGYSEDRDSDGDTLTDYEEQHTHKTNAFHCDTDSDGFYDNLELEHGTDPLNSDTDNDGIFDGTELRAGTDPLKADNDLTFEVILTAKHNTAATLTLSGDASVYDGTLQVFNVTGLNNTPGVMSDAYWVYSPSREKGTLTIQVGANEQELSIYKLNNDLTYTKIKTSIEESNSGLTLSAKVGNGRYLAGVCSFLDNIKANTEAIDVFLLLDDSGSMYNEMMDGQGNDPEYKRIAMCKQLLSNASKDIRFGLATFTANYMEKSPIVEDRSKLIAELDTLQNTPYSDKESQFNGTFISTSIYHALDNFTANNPRRQILVLLTDGETTEGGFGGLLSDTKSLSTTLSKANERNVTIIVVALGHSVDVNYLTEIETSTNGAYIHANSADAMEDLYATILNAVNLNFADTDDDGKNDSIIVADTGFRPDVNGFQFRNCLVLGENFDSLGMCYGISSFCSLYYQNKLPTAVSDMTTTDWNLWWFRKLNANNESVTQPCRIQGYNVIDLNQAGFDIDETGKLRYSFELGEWKSSTMDRYCKYFKWPVTDEYFIEVFPDAPSFTMKYYSEKAEKILEGEPLIKPIIVNKMAYPALDLTVSSGSLSGDDLSTQALLRILMRYQVSQYQESTRKEHTYKFIDDFTTIEHSLSSGIPLVLCTSDHAVNVCRMRQDLENPNLYYLDLYDSNYSGKGTTMTAEVKIDASGNKYTEFQYGDTFSDVTFYDPHF